MGMLSRDQEPPDVPPTNPLVTALRRALGAEHPTSAALIQAGRLLRDIQRGEVQRDRAHGLGVERFALPQSHRGHCCSHETAVPCVVRPCLAVYGNRRHAPVPTA